MEDMDGDCSEIIGSNNEQSSDLGAVSHLYNDDTDVSIDNLCVMLGHASDKSRCDLNEKCSDITSDHDVDMDNMDCYFCEIIGRSSNQSLDIGAGAIHSSSSNGFPACDYIKMAIYSLLPILKQRTYRH